MRHILPQQRIHGAQLKTFDRLEGGRCGVVLVLPYDVSDYSDYYTGQNIVIADKGPCLEWVDLPQGFNYQYSFMFIDVYGNYHYSDPMDFEY